MLRQQRIQNTHTSGGQPKRTLPAASLLHKSQILLNIRLPWLCLHMYINKQHWLPCVNAIAFLSYQQKRKMKVTHGRCRTRGSVHFECRTSIFSTHKTEHNRGRLHSLGAQHVKQRKLGLIQIFSPNLQGCINLLRYATCLSCQWYCTSPATCSCSASTRICREQRTEDCDRASSAVSAGQCCRIALNTWSHSDVHTTLPGWIGS